MVLQFQMVSGHGLIIAALWAMWLGKDFTLRLPYE